jgi:hypothetical protein
VIFTADQVTVPAVPEEQVAVPVAERAGSLVIPHRSWQQFREFFMPKKISAHCFAEVLLGVFGEMAVDVCNLLFLKELMAFRLNELDVLKDEPVEREDASFGWAIREVVGFCC